MELSVKVDEDVVDNLVAEAVADAFNLNCALYRQTFLTYTPVEEVEELEVHLEALAVVYDHFSESPGMVEHLQNFKAD